MPHLLTLRGRHALSPFRVSQAPRRARGRPIPDHAVAGISATFWHFVETRTRALTAAERATLERLLTYGPHDERKPTTAASLLLVVPRPGTISPWSSKATDIARNCGLEPVVRIERGIALPDRHARRRSRSTARRAPRCCRCCTTG